MNDFFQGRVEREWRGFVLKGSPKFPDAAPECSPRLIMTAGFLAGIVAFAPTLLMLLARLLLLLLLPLLRLEE
jgi:hypothetical protein